MAEIEFFLNNRDDISMLNAVSAATPDFFEFETLENIEALT